MQCTAAMRLLTICTLALVSIATSACTDVGEGEPMESGEAPITEARKLYYATTIRDVAAQRGLTNGALLAGIALSETGMTHCWSEATWACKGPASPTCDGGPVIAGAGDGPCRLKQGGLGMFQFDGGTFDQTLRRDGTAILTIEGNVDRAVDFVVDKVIQDIPGISTSAEALAWMNSIAMDTSTTRMQQWGSLMACRYNGCCNSSATCRTRRAGYMNNAVKAYKGAGAAFWNTSR